MTKRMWQFSSETRHSHYNNYNAAVQYLPLCMQLHITSLICASQLITIVDITLTKYGLLNIYFTKPDKFYFAKLETITRRNHNYTKTENNPFSLIAITKYLLARGFGTN